MRHTRKAVRATHNKTTQTEPERPLVTKYGADYHRDPGCHGLQSSTTGSIPESGNFMSSKLVQPVYGSEEKAMTLQRRVVSTASPCRDFIVQPVLLQVATRMSRLRFLVLVTTLERHPYFGMFQGLRLWTCEVPNVAPRTATVKAVTDLEAVKITREELVHCFMLQGLGVTLSMIKIRPGSITCVVWPRTSLK
eukprot:3197145-Amphidinium_carterae.1